MLNTACSSQQYTLFCGRPDTFQVSIPYTVFRARRITFFLANRVKNQNEPKRPQSGDRLGSFWCSTRASADTGTN